MAYVSSYPQIFTNYQESALKKRQGSEEQCQQGFLLTSWLTHTWHAYFRKRVPNTLWVDVVPADGISREVGYFAIVLIGHVVITSQRSLQLERTSCLLQNRMKWVTGSGCGYGMKQDWYEHRIFEAGYQNMSILYTICSTFLYMVEIFL